MKSVGVILGSTFLKCGPTRLIQFCVPIFVMKKKHIRCSYDQGTHFCSTILHPDFTQCIKKQYGRHEVDFGNVLVVINLGCGNKPLL